MRSKTHFWKQFMTGDKNYMVVITNKNEQFPVIPDMFSSDFKTIGV